MEHLIEEVWNAPLKMGEPNIRSKLDKIEAEKVWNIPIEAFRKNSGKAEEADEKNLRNVRRPAENVDLKPRKLGVGTDIMLDEGVLIQFRHRRPDGSINEHKDAEITEASLREFIRGQVKNFGTEEFGYCYMYTDGCKARLYPEEVQEYLPEDLYEDYRKKFNRKFQRGGGRGKRMTRRKRRLGVSRGIFLEAKDAMCAIGMRRNSRRTRRVGR
jgi:hypothetical protein